MNSLSDMIAKTQYSLRQIKISENLYSRLKHYCVVKKITLTNFYKNMLDWFIQQRQSETNFVFLASVNHGKRLSLWIRNDQLHHVKQVADQAQVSDARVIYTYFLTYVDTIGL